MILVVRDGIVLESAVNGAWRLVNHLLRGAESAADEYAAVQGIWMNSRLDEELPGPPACTAGRKAIPGGPDREKAAAGASSGYSAAFVSETFSLSGQWTVCVFDGPALKAAAHANERLLIMLDVLFGAVRSCAPGVFYPVFRMGMPKAEIDSACSLLNAGHDQKRATRFY